MINTQTLNVVGFVSQTTFAMTMALLAWADRRSRGMVWLAAAAIAQLLTTFSRYMVVNDPHGIVQAASCGLAVLIFFCSYKGLHWFVIRNVSSTRWFTGVVLLAAVMVTGIALKVPSAGLFLSRIVVSLTCLVIIGTLWRTRERALRMAARVCALQFMLMICLVAMRIYTDSMPDSPFQDRLDVYGRIAAMGFVILLFLSFIGMFVAESKRRLQVESRMDALTGLSNRRAIEEFAAEAMAFSKQNNLPLALLMLDIDHFKRLNDTWGHWQGDRALHALGAVLRTGTRTCDYVARMGGEEFAVLLPGQDASGATVIAERLRKSVEELSLNEDKCSATMTVSIGVSTLRLGESNWADMLRRADKALYKAKREGRNRVMQHSDELASMEAEPRKENLHLRTGTAG